MKNIVKRSFSSRSFNLSYKHNTSPKPLIYKTIGDQLLDTTNQFPSNLAVASMQQNVEMTYHQLYLKSKDLAAAFIHLGLEKHDRIGIYSPNNVEWVLTQFAAAMADLILVNINPAYQTHELEYALNKVECKAIICPSHFKSSNYIEMLRQVNAPSLKIKIKIDKGQPEDGFYHFHDLFEMSTANDIMEVSHREAQMNPDDITNIQFTSGTTGSPKGASLTHFNILNNGFFVGDRLNYTHQDKVCISVPLYHCFGMVLGNLACINHGSSMIYPSDGFNPQKSLEAITKYKCTSLYGVPTMFYEYLNEYRKQPSKYDITALRTGIIAGSLAPSTLMKQIINELNLKEITNCYGMTETSPVSSQTFRDDNFDEKTTTVGTMLPYVEAKIIDEKGQTVIHDTPGEFCFRGYLVMKEYWNDKRATKNTIDKSGFLHSGDLATMNDKGYVTIVGRIKDMIIRGGENVYPKEIEDFLMQMEQIEQVQVVGCHDLRMGEEIAALIKLKDGCQIERQQVYEYCHKKIAHFKIPKYVKFVNDYPITVTGKPQKYKMRDEINEELKNKDLYEIMKIR